MRLVTYNTQYGVGRDGRFDLERIAKEVEGADIIALQEVTRNFARNGGIDMIEGLAALLPNYFYAFGVAMGPRLRRHRQRGKPLNQRFQFGNMVLSRFPIVASRNLLLPRTLRFSRGNLQRSALEALVIAPSGPLRILFRAYGPRFRHRAHLTDQPPQGTRLRICGRGRRDISGSANTAFPNHRVPGIRPHGRLQHGPLLAQYMLMAGEQDDAARVAGADPVDVYSLGEGLSDDAVSWVDDSKARDEQADRLRLRRGKPCREGRQGLDRPRGEGLDHLPVWFNWRSRPTLLRARLP